MVRLLALVAALVTSPFAVLAKDAVEEQGAWSQLTRGPGFVQFVRPATGAPSPATPRAWVKYEYDSEQTRRNGQRFWSVTDLYELDCRGGRWRVLQTTYYAEPNEGGGIVGSSVFEASPWVEQVPRTAAAAVAQRFCPTEQAA